MAPRRNARAPLALLKNTVTVQTPVLAQDGSTDHRGENQQWREIAPRSHGVLAHPGQSSDAVCLWLEATSPHE